MRYIRVHWNHGATDLPVELYSELDDGSWEVRKVYIYPDGRAEYAGPEGGVGETLLGEAPLPPVDEIARDPEFDPSVIDQQEFEAVWEAAHRQPVGRR